MLHTIFGANNSQSLSSVDWRVDDRRRLSTYTNLFLCQFYAVFNVCSRSHSPSANFEDARSGKSMINQWHENNTWLLIKPAHW